MITLTDIFAGAGGSSTGAASVPGGVRRYPGNPAYLVSPDGTVYGPRRFALKGHVLPDGYRRVTIAGRHVLRHLALAFNIDATHVWRIVTNRSWRHVA